MHAHEPDQPGAASPDIAALRAVALARTQPASRQGRLAVALLGALAAAVVVGFAWAALTSASEPVRLEPPRSSAASAAQASPVASVDRVDWRPVLADLDTLRSQAFATGEIELLDRVYAPASAVLAEDRWRLTELRTAGLSARGLRLSLVTVRLVRAEAGGVMLEVRDRLLAYVLVDRNGTVVERRQGRGAQSWQVSIVPAGEPADEWRISSIEPTP